MSQVCFVDYLKAFMSQNLAFTCEMLLWPYYFHITSILDQIVAQHYVLICMFFSYDTILQYKGIL